MMTLRHDAPAAAAGLRQALYDGAIFQLPPTAATRRLVEEVLPRIEEELGPGMREAQFRLSDEEFFARAGRLRKLFYTTPHFHRLLEAIVISLGFSLSRIAYDPLRLRVVAHRGFENPKAAPIYYAHRDTWYAHSQAEITWWVPLHDAAAEETFVFYPDCFAKPVPNNSEAFDHDDWTRHGSALRIGWQDARHGSTRLYPGQVGEFDPGRAVSFAARAGELVLFCGAHFHQTRKNTAGRTRFSIDFRTVDLDDHGQGRGAPNVDNRSRGSALRDYVHRL
jgi:hypothetical protein